MFERRSHCAVCGYPLPAAASICGRCAHPVAAVPIPQPEAQPPQAKPQPEWIKRLGPLGVVATAALKFKTAILLLLAKAKFLIFGLAKLQTLLSMLATLGVYWSLYGWRFAAGFVIGIYIHEMGHVWMLRHYGLRVSIDSFDRAEVSAAVAAGAELVLSVNSTNLDAARDWGCEVVAVPDVPATLEGLERTVETLANWSVPFRIDPVIEPIGFGFAASLGRYLDVRRRYPDAAMLMGVGNLTELTDVDSAGVNVMLIGFCQELGIRSVLTTQVINWCRTCVREIDLARRLVYHACHERVLPKHLEPGLVLLREPRLQEHGEATLAELAQRVTDRNFRLFAERGMIHVINGKMYLQGDDPFDLFEQMQAREEIDPSHAFYLGYEMAKALTALALGKNYVQDQALRWGFLTRPEESHRDGIA